MNNKCHICGKPLKENEEMFFKTCKKCLDNMDKKKK